MNEIDLLFETAFKIIETKFSSQEIEKSDGKIYKITNSKDNRVYIGSTINDLDIRLKYHMDYCVNEKMKEYLNDLTIKMNIELIFEKKFYFDNEMLLYEDYYIYKNDSLNNGINSKYNTEITRVILAQTVGNFADKLKIIDRIIDLNYREYINYRNICQDANINDIINSFADVYIENNYFTKFDDNMYVCFPDHLINKYIDVNGKNVVINYKTGIYDSDIIGIYYIEWDNGNNLIFYKYGGLHAMFKIKSNMYYNKFFKSVSKYGLNFKLYPLYYFKMINNDISPNTSNNFFRNCIINLNTKCNKMKNINIEIPNLLRLQQNIRYKDIEGKIYCTNLLNDMKIKLFSNHNNKIINETNKLVEKNKRITKQNNLRITLENHNTSDEIIINDSLNNKHVDQIDNLEQGNDGIKYGNFVFTKKMGRKTQYNDDERKKAKIEAKRKWREKNRDRIKEYNKYYMDEKKILDK